MFLLGYISTKNADSKLYKPINSYCSRLAQTVTDFADASHSESAKSTTTTVLYGIFSSENSYPCTVTIIFLLLLPQTPPGSPLTAHRSQG